MSNVGFMSVVRASWYRSCSLINAALIKVLPRALKSLLLESGNFYHLVTVQMVRALHKDAPGLLLLELYSVHLTRCADPGPAGENISHGWTGNVRWNWNLQLRIENSNLLSLCRDPEPWGIFLLGTHLSHSNKDQKQPSWDGLQKLVLEHFQILHFFRKNLFHIL